MCIVEDISNKEFKKLVQDVLRTRKDVTEIKDALLGTEYIKKGYIIRLEDLEKEMRNLNVIKWKITGAAAGISTVVSVVLMFILKIFL